MLFHKSRKTRFNLSTGHALYKTGSSFLILSLMRNSMEKRCKSNPKLQKRFAAEELLLKYYNRVLLEKGLITEREHNLMIHKNDSRTAMYLTR